MTDAHQAVIDIMSQWQTAVDQNDKCFLKHFFASKEKEGRFQPLCMGSVSFSDTLTTVNYYTKGGHYRSETINTEDFVKWYEEQ